MDLSKPGTLANLEAAFGGESMANRKYLFFADVARQLGNPELAKLFRDTAAQETEHAFAHFRLLHPELVVADPAALSEAEKQTVLSRCLELAIEGETYEYTTMYPEFAAQARTDRDGGAEAEFNEQIAESAEHAGIFRRAASNFGRLTPIEHHHADRYTVALEALQGQGTAGEGEPVAGQWICKVCSMIYDPAIGDLDSGIVAGTPFEAIPDDWSCPICGTRKANFIPYREPALLAV
ncbi:rubrerythrin family protein [Synechococcus sp. Tobar12-5m-g]|uniref:rubrerythrin family protein n=1 Tax=unclassified Synechococcus TaxID=2626047 RepID=UPI0028F4170F|nr:MULTISPECIES: rubrerythrin family protein [unclassified Synechococcus]MCP9772829.1 rubrerythrin family protein [Synechococcus sp. Tobar12-5m-g]MCP9873705.1 rubrerythrin family protein [Synechococcus sp. Cruz CV-v-12]